MFTQSGLQRLAEIICSMMGTNSIRKFANQIGISHSSISRILNCKSLPTLETLCKIAQHSEYTTNQLVDIILEQEKVPYVEKVVHQYTLDEIVELMQKLPHEEKRQIIKMFFEELSCEVKRRTLIDLIQLL